MKEGNTSTENLDILVVEFSSIVHFIFGSNAVSVENLRSLNGSSEAFQSLADWKLVFGNEGCKTACLLQGY